MAVDRDAATSKLGNQFGGGLTGPSGPAARGGDPGRVPPGPGGVADPEEVSGTPVLSPKAHEVSDAEAELLVSEAAAAPPTWATSRNIAGLVGLIAMLVIVGLGVWTYTWLSDEGDEVLTPAADVGAVDVDPAAD